MNILPEGWPRGSGYAHGVIGRGQILFIAGQIGWDPRSRRIADGGFAAQTAQALANVKDVLSAAGGSPEHLARMTWYITDRAAYLRDRRTIGDHYRELFGRHYPAIAVVIVTDLLESGALVEIEATAVLPEPAHTTPGGG